MNCNSSKPSNFASLELLQRPFLFAAHDGTTNHSPPRNFRSLLGLGFTFCPSPFFSTTDITETLSLLERDIHIKTYFAVDDHDTYDDDELFKPKVHIKSD
jgi:hypothetical protein